MEIGSRARVVEPAEYAAMGMVIERVSEGRWERRDIDDPTWAWSCGGGRTMLVSPENSPERGGEGR